MTEEQIALLFETRRLIETGRFLFPTSGFLQKSFFSQEIEDDAEKVDVVLKKGSKKLAPFVNPRIAGKLVESAKKEVSTYKPAYIKQKFITEATDILTQSNRPIYANDETLVERVADNLADELGEHTDNIERRVEWMAAQTLQTGKCPIVGDGVDEVIDCLFDASQIVTLSGSSLFTDASSSPMDTFIKIRKERVDAGGKAPDRLVLGAELYSVYMNHPETKDMFNDRRIDRGSLKPEMLEEGVIYIGYIPEIKTDVYMYDETYIDETETTQYLLNPKGFIYGSTKAEGKVVYGCIKDLKALYATKVFVKSWEVEDPSVRYVLMQSAPVTIPTYKDSFAYVEAM